MNSKISLKPIIDVKNIGKSFHGITVISDLTLQISSGTIVGFLGANGSGKTTSLRLLSGLIFPDKGTGTCLDLNLFTQTKLIQRQIGYMPQNFCLYQNLSVYENLDFIARIYGLKKRKQRLEEIIELISLKEKRHQIARTLSGGWQKRLALAAALLHKPRILLLDEPTSGIDPYSRLVIWEHIQNLVSEGVTVLLSTHYMDEAERCHQLAYIAFGKILAHGSVADIIHSTGLYTWRIKGKQLTKLKSLLKIYSDDIQLIEKANEIRIGSLQKDAVKKLDSNLFINYEVDETETTLEDVFIFKIQHQGKIK